jgi:hypothetical protein
MFNYLINKSKTKKVKLTNLFNFPLKKKHRLKLRVSSTKTNVKKYSSFDYFYWKYIYGDFVISKFINFLVKSGHKNRAIKLFFKALLNLKTKFGINPILLVKYIVLKRNVLHKVTKKKVKQKTFYSLRLLDFEKQISNTIKKIMELIFFLKAKKKVKLWQSIFLVLLNFSILKNKKKNASSFKYDHVNFNINVSKVLKTFSLLRIFKQVRNKFLRLYLSLKGSVFLMNKIFIFIYRFKKYIGLHLDHININNLPGILSLLSFNKNLYFYLTCIKYRLAILNSKFLNKLKRYRNKLRNFFYSFKRLKNKHLLNRIDLFRKRIYKKKMLLKNKSLLRSKYKQHFLTRFFFKDLSELKKASKSKNSFLNFKLRNKKRKELSIGTRIHSKHDVRLRHRKIFFRVSKYGQVKK